MKKFLHFLDEHLLGFMAGFLLLFIPLYPKIPIAEILPGYIVRLRLEDLIITCTLLLYGIQVLRGKATFWRTPLTKPIILYAVVGLLAIISGVFIVDRIPYEALHINKALLHYFRRLEYFSLFFIFFSTVKSLRQAKIYIGVYLLAVLGVMIYGFGQKYLYWCAFSTMNREFSKGWCLYLTPHARVMSTFGGHYDLAAFTMITLAMLWSLVIGVKNKFSKLLLAILLAGSFWLIILTASRVSFISYIVALTIVFFLWMFRKGIVWASSRWLGAFVLSMFLMLSFGDLSDRFLHLLKLDERFGGFNQLLFKPIGEPPKNGQALDELAQVADKTDVPPSTTKPDNDRPADVEKDIPDYRNVTDADGNVVAVPVKRVYSEAAKKFDLSTGIRLDALWPKAWQGYLNNPLVGSGYSTLTKDKATDFTEAESTDNGFLRSLGETGALGTWAFYAIIFTVLLRALWAMQGIDDPVFFSFIVGGIAATVGLLINNLYIDTFEASKVAFPFWALAGVMLGGIESEKDRIAKKRTPLKLNLNFKTLMQKMIRIIRSDVFILFVILVLAFVLRLHKFNTPLADWHSWRQADTSSVTRNFFKDGIHMLYPTYDDVSSIASGQPNPKGYRMVEFPIYNAVSTFIKKLIPEVDFHQAGRLTSILASLGTLSFLFLLVRKYISRRAAMLTGIFFAVLPYNIFYSRVVLPEPFLLFASTGMIWMFDKWIEQKFKVQSSKFKIKEVVYFILAIVFSAMALLIKPSAGFLFLPIAYLIWRHIGLRGLINPWIIAYGILTVVPFIWWRWWISHFPEGIPAYTWLLNGNNIRFKGAFFFWIFADRIGRLILGYWGVILLFLGIIGKPNTKEGWFFYTWLLGILLYLFTFATGNVQHDYYQAITIPILCIFLAKGADFLLKMPRDIINKKMSLLMLGVIAFFMLSFGWYHIRDFFNINHPEIAEAGSEVDRLTKSNGRVIAPYQGDTAFLYQTNRKGWPIMEGSIDEMVAKGAHYYVSTNYDDLTKELIAEAENPRTTKPYKILKQTPQYVIIQLVPDKKLPQ